MIHVLILFTASTVAIVAVRHLIRTRVKPVDQWSLDVQIPESFGQYDKELLASTSKEHLRESDYQAILEYLLMGIDAYRSPHHARIIYPGVSGSRGSVIEGLEGYARTAPLLATWVASGRPETVSLPNGNPFNLKKHLLHGLKAGTQPESPEYWGDITDLDQRIVEAADIGLVLWLLKDQLHTELTGRQLDQALSWISQINGKQIYGGNWLLFRIIVNAVLRDFGWEGLERDIADDYREFKSFYVGEGWFTDGMGGAIDYYNVWQMQYMLFWLDRIAPSTDPDFLNGVFSEFASNYQYFIGTEGIPIFGRSCCYRLAAATPLIIMAHRSPASWSSIARRALETTWLYFIKHGALRSGGISQGYHGDDEDLLENYSGRASPFWSLRSLALAFLLPPDHEFWCGEPGSLPVEKADYRISVGSINATVIGEKATGDITVAFNSRNKDSRNRPGPPPFRRMSVLRRQLQRLLKRPLRIENYEAKYQQPEYYSAKPFFEQSTDSPTPGNRRCAP
ncbi:DUF2264 domain-containing protein [Marinobacter oulmenensis]|uniref:DUF2264 domain-containing protein n=1 Tax=Marinobacter oulmenensis TaxID=643747 RepID=A0A840UDA4_9GAMM|nr:DUF2264 domain-containing protein [Marinobacter oulmenensis]MBB5320691.1 hypothetical protein [Marinobacter oulmenensis]